MELLDFLVILLVVLIFWALIPGLLSGWMLREGGSSFTGGFVLGAVCGPAGVVIALTIFVLNDFQTRRRKSGAPYAHPSRIYYDVPLFGRLHVSTVWTLAGLATFVCTWALGGLFYELYLHDPYLRQEQQTAAVSAGTNAPPQSADPQADADAAAGDNATVATEPNGMSGASAQAGTTQQLREQATGGVSSASSAPQSQTLGGQPAPPIIPGMSSTFATMEAPAGQPSVASAPTQAGAAGPSLPPTDAPQVSSAQLRSAAVGEVTQSLGARGHRVHAALSGDNQTSTLSLSGASLTREVGNQLLGAGRTRATLKAAGIRIVVILNGQESWTYML